MANDNEMLKIKMAIKAKKIKHKDLASQIGMTASSFSRCLSGKRALGSSARILLAQKLDLNVEAVQVIGVTKTAA